MFCTAIESWTTMNGFYWLEQIKHLYCNSERPTLDKHKWRRRRRITSKTNLAKIKQLGRIRCTTSKKVGDNLTKKTKENTKQQKIFIQLIKQFKKKKVIDEYCEYNSTKKFS